jgi:NADH:ubiquinone oxidoreductase subunit D
MTEEELTEIERANHVRALERELSRVQAHAIKTASALIDVGAAIAEKYAQTPEQRVSIRRTIGTVVDELIDGLYPQAGDERDE